MRYYLRCVDHQIGEYDSFFGDNVDGSERFFENPRDAVMAMLNSVWSGWENAPEDASCLLRQSGAVVDDENRVVRSITFRKPANFAESAFPVAVIMDAEKGVVLGAYTPEWGVVRSAPAEAAG